jgi:SAM-dependent methyltransferase
MVGEGRRVQYTLGGGGEEVLRRANMKVELRDLLGAVNELQVPGFRLGWPDDPTWVTVSDPKTFADRLVAALSAFRDLRGTPFLMDADINSPNRQVWIRFVMPGGCLHDVQIEPRLEKTLQSFHEVVSRDGGKVLHSGGNNYFNISLPYREPIRESFPKVDDLPWDARYRKLLELASWKSLRGMVFRFSKLAEGFAEQCVRRGKSKVLIPSVGMCIHPWLFADRGLNVIATDAAHSALAVVSEPAAWPRLFSRSAFERWDITECALHASQRNPHHFDSMPDLQNSAVRRSLYPRVEFAAADWAKLPLESGGVDALFATNALPRETKEERDRVLQEWKRVVKRGGIAFIAQHNFFVSEFEKPLRDARWEPANILKGDELGRTDSVAYQIYRSSG